MKYFFSLIAVILLTSFGNVYEDNETLEITKTDITAYPKVNTANITVFGIKLGMTREKAKQLAEKANLLYLPDGMHTTGDYRVYVYDKDARGEKRNCILYLIWTNNVFTLTDITFFEDFDTYLVGNTKKLLTTDVIDNNSDIVKNYLGKPDDSEVTLDIESIGLKHTTSYYDSRGINITLKKNDGATSVVFAFCKPGKRKRK